MFGEGTIEITPADRIAVGFAHFLREADLAVPVGSVTTFVEALGRVGIQDRDAVYWAGRATLIRKPEDIPVYDGVFNAFWLRLDAVVNQATGIEQIIELAVDDDSENDDDHGDGEADVSDSPVMALRWSDQEVLTERDFAECSAQELAEIRELIAQIRVVGSRRQARRHRRTRRGRGRLDLRRTVRTALRTGGDPARRWFTEPDDRPRRIVMLLDVSGSMETYARELLCFAHTAVAARAQVEVFTFGTRLTRVTRELNSHDPDEALRAANDAIADWSGGTRIGQAIREFNDQWGVRGMARGAIVVILSDGWDRGEPEHLGEQMRRLQRVAYRVVWVNPLKYTPGYEPLARGMAAALPYVDEFVEGHSVGALRDLAAMIDR